MASRRGNRGAAPLVLEALRIHRTAAGIVRELNLPANTVKTALHVLRKEGRAFTAGHSRAAQWALSQAEADEALRLHTAEVARGGRDKARDADARYRAGKGRPPRARRRDGGGAGPTISAGPVWSWSLPLDPPGRGVSRVRGPDGIVQPALPYVQHTPSIGADTTRA